MKMAPALRVLSHFLTKNVDKYFLHLKITLVYNVRQKLVLSEGI